MGACDSPSCVGSAQQAQVPRVVVLICSETPRQSEDTREPASLRFRLVRSIATLECAGGRSSLRSHTGTSQPTLGDGEATLGDPGDQGSGDLLNREDLPPAEVLCYSPAEVASRPSHPPPTHTPRGKLRARGARTSLSTPPGKPAGSPLPRSAAPRPACSPACDMGSVAFP